MNLFKVVSHDEMDRLIETHTVKAKGKKTACELAYKLHRGENKRTLILTAEKL